MSGAAQFGDREDVGTRSVEVATYDAAGNVYHVIARESLPAHVDLAALAQRLSTSAEIGRSDGLLIGSCAMPPTLRIFNPDGSEAEKSGNGLRIFARFLFDAGHVGVMPFEVLTKGGDVVCQVKDRGERVRVAMGRASFWAHDVPVLGADREVVDEFIDVNGSTIEITALSIGNPHCVVFVRHFDDDPARNVGPSIETHPLFPRRTNVQFAHVESRTRIRAHVWERGAGLTASSGSSACAVVAAAHRHGLVDREVLVVMPGGELEVEFADDGMLHLEGPVRSIARSSIVL